AGFIMRKEVRNISTAASGVDETILPLDYPYMGLLVSALKTTILPDAIISNLKLTVDADRIVLYDMVGTDVLEMNIDGFPEAVENIVPLSDTAATFLSDIYYRQGAVFDIAGATGKGAISSVTGESVVAAMTTGQAAGTMRIRCAGYSPHASFYLPFGSPSFLSDDDSAWFDPRQGVAQMKLKSTQATASATLTVVTEQLRV
ncbi:MAG: hypothetical protein KGL35_10940, partial [Bradyrhizobium sp.]|nr:hypothetical protein [Bradyrhizobium sp.]